MALADKYMSDLVKELNSLKLTGSAKRKNKKNEPTEGGTSQVEIPDSDGEGIRDPTATTSRGRPGEKRKKSGLHLKASKPVKCSVCG